MDNIALVDLTRPLEELADELGRSFSEFGFAVIRNHGIPDELIERVEEMQKALFDLPEEVKRSYDVPGGGGARGYTPFGKEIAKDAKVHDLKEFWHIGRSLPEGHELAAAMAPNVWPRELPGFKATMEEVYAAFEKTGDRILRAIALHLGLAEDYFVPTVKDGNSVMRLLHYPPLPEEAPEGAVRAAAHGDINTITLLLGAEEAGLELLTKSGRMAGDRRAGRRAGGERRRHARPADQFAPALDHPPRGQPGGRGRAALAIFDAVLPSLPARFPDQAAAGLRPRRRLAAASDHGPRLPAAAPARNRPRVSVAKMPQCSKKSPRLSPICKTFVEFNRSATGKKCAEMHA